jgi:hypothetical protein
MAKKATTDLAIKPAVNPIIHVDARIAVGMFFTLTGTILSAFGISTRDHIELYARSQGIDVNLWWGLVLLAFGIVMLAFGRRGQMKTDKSAK